MIYFSVLSKRLKNWEIRERKKARDYSKETEREDERRREMVGVNFSLYSHMPHAGFIYFNSALIWKQMKEAKRLKEFLEDYDDDRDDPKYYR